MSPAPDEGAVTLAVDVEAEALHAVAGDVLVAPFFEDDRPLRGPAARADWRLCGLLSERLAEGALRGAAGEAALLPGTGPIRAARCLALGLGPRARFSEARLREAAADAGRRLQGLRARVAVFGLAEEGAWALAADRAAAAVVGGVAEALAARPRALRLRLAVAPAEVHAARRGVEEAARGAPSEVAVRVARDAAARSGAPRAEPSGGVSRLAAPARAPSSRP